MPRVRIDIANRNKVFINPADGTRLSKLKGGVPIETATGEKIQNRGGEETGGGEEKSEDKKEI